MIASLRLQNFRSYKDSSFEFSDGVNIIIGPNASGKTNILEGLIYISSGSGFRATDQENIRHGQAWARLDGLTTTNQTRVIKLETTLQGSPRAVSKSFEIDEVARKRLSFDQTIPVVLFEPDNLQQLTTSPDRRRSFIDAILSQTDSHYAKQLRDYARVLAQRNRLLKQGLLSAKDSIFAWNIRLSDLGGQIAAKRWQLIEELNKGLGSSYSQLADKKHQVGLAYQSPVAKAPSHYATQMLKKLETSLEKDLARGFTSLGPHRDDIEITINQIPIYHHASRGETRTTLLALKTQETKLLEKTTGQKPLLMLDDVFSELDGRRRTALTKFISQYQSFITTTDADVVSKKFTNQAQLISLG